MTFKSIIHFLKYQRTILKYNLYNKIKIKLGINKNQRQKKIIVSLTTYPERFDTVYLTIETLMDQILKADKIILWLYEEEYREKLLKNIKTLEKRGLEIKLVNENIKSYKKLIYTIAEFSEDIIITVDDDVLYPSDFIENLYNQYLNYPECIIAYRCSVMQKESNTDLMPYLSWKNAKAITKPSFDLFPTGVGGILYPENTLHSNILNKELFLKLAPNADDIWFKAMGLLNEIKTMQVFPDSVEFTIIKGSQNTALWKTNNGEKENDLQLKKVFDYFDLYKYIGKKDIE